MLRTCACAGACGGARAAALTPAHRRIEQLCNEPFWWNQTVKWNVNRQHHCRACGSALCDACSMSRTVIPKMGFESPMRVCQSCLNSVQPNEKRSRCCVTAIKQASAHREQHVQ